jgi:transcriptional regulator with XRE-family HTH domain
MKKADFQKSFGKHLKKVRLERKLSIRELELRGSIERSTISKLESGLLNPTLFTIRKICDALEINFEEFFKGYTK